MKNGKPVYHDWTLKDLIVLYCIKETIRMQMDEKDFSENEREIKEQIFGEVIQAKEAGR